MNDQITIRGARTHNLKNIDCDLTHGLLTVVSGVSGSGKSSLAFDTIYAEGQRRYVESLSAYARQFLERIEKPDVDLIDGLAPAIAIKQKNSTRNPRSTVATATEIYDYLRLLFARCGTAHCIVCGGVVRRDTVDEIAASILALGEDTRLYALFPVKPTVLPEAEPKKQKEGESPVNPALPNDAFKERLNELRTRGFNRLYQNGKIVEFSTPESLLDLDFGQALYALVDRLVVSAENRARIVDAAEIGFRESGEIVFETVPRDEQTEPRRLRFSQAFECKLCHRIYREPEPRLFSFNNPYGACERCQGFGNTIDFDINLIIPDKQQDAERGSDRSLDSPQVPPLPIRAQKSRDAAWHSAGHAVAGVDAGAAGLRAGWAWIFPRRARLLRLFRAQEIQAARARDAEQVSGLRGVSGVQRNPFAGRSPGRAHQRAQYLRGFRTHHPRGAPPV